MRRRAPPFGPGSAYWKPAKPRTAILTRMYVRVGGWDMNVTPKAPQ